MDISVDYYPQVERGFCIMARGNFTYAVSEYNVYEEPVYLNEWWKSRRGYSLSQQWGYIAERLFVDDIEVANSPNQNFGIIPRGGDIKFKDVNGDGQISALDQVPIGNPTAPEIVYGRSEEHTSELQSLMRISYAVVCLKKKITQIIRAP